MISFLLAAALFAPGADASSGVVGETKEPIVIHFRPLPRGEFHSFLMIVCSDGDAGHIAPLIIAGGAARDVRDSCRRLLRRRGWTVLSFGEAELVLVSNPEGRTVKAVSIEGIIAVVTPTIRK